MKVKFLLLVAVLTTIFTSCQNTEEPKEISKPGANGNFRIEIVGNQAEQQASRSSGTIQFEGGTASGAGLYNSKDKANVSATPDDGYEIDYFFGGPESEPKKYDNANSGASSFNVDIDGQDHLFHVGFKKKERTLTINAESGGSVTPSGKDIYQVNKPITITATAKPGYKFAGWEINEGDVTIADKSNANTTATLNSLNSTITAKFNPTTPFCYIILCDEQFETRDMQNRAIIYYYDLGEIPDKEDTYNQVQYSVYEWEYDLKINMIGTNEFLGWYDGSNHLIEATEDLHIEDITRNYPKGSTIYARIKLGKPKPEAPSSVTVKITNSGTGYDILYGNQFPSSWPRYDMADVVQYKLVSSWGTAGTLKLYYSSFTDSPYCTITGANSYYPISWYRDEERSTATITRWEWTVGTETAIGYCSSIHEVKGELEYNGIQYSISISY